MVLFVALVAALLIVLTLSRSKPLRIAAGVAIALIIVFVAWQQFAARQEREASLQRVPPSQVELVGLEPKPGYAGSFRLGGRLVNHSKQYTLDRVTVDVKVDDCPAEAGAPCVTIGETAVTVNASVPPEQARDFEEQMSFERAALKPRGRMVWHYTVQAVRAR